MSGQTTNSGSPPHTVGKVVCSACGCLCDDICVSTSQGRIESVERACDIGLAWLNRHRDPQSLPEACVAGIPCTLAEAVARAAERLKHARAPRISGLTSLAIEDIQSAVALADLLNAAIDHDASETSIERSLAKQRLGIVSATLGEVRNRADLVVYWACDPLTTHPRHVERFIDTPPSRFLPRGRADRCVLVVDKAPNATAPIADHVFEADPKEQRAVLAAARARVLGKPTRCMSSKFDSILDRFVPILTQARYGALFVGADVRDATTWEALLALVRDLNVAGTRRFVLLSLSGAGNAAGAEAVLGWQAGAPCRVDYARGVPQYRPELRVTSAGTNDVLVWLGEDHDAAAIDASARVVHIGPGATRPSHTAEIAIQTARAGIDCSGTFMRGDGVMLPARGFRTSSAPRVAAVLNMIQTAIQNL